MTAVTVPDTTTPPTLLAAFHRTVERTPDAIAVRTLDSAVTRTWAGLDERARRAAAALRTLGVGPGDTVGLLLDNDIPFFEADLGAALLGAVPVSVYPTSSPEQIAHVASDAGFRVVVTRGAFAELARAGVAAVPGATLVSTDPGVDGALDWDTLLAAEPLADEDLPHATGDDLLTIIYTSGTTGPSKGVELTHDALLAATAAVSQMAKTGPEVGGRVISWLPLAHIAERIASYYMALSNGLEVVVCPDAREVGAYLPQVQPTFFFAVPRFWEKLRVGLEAKIATLPQEAQDAIATGNPEVLAGLRAAVGLGQVELASIGAAPSAPELISFFHGLGVPLSEIYGLTECCAVCTSNPKEAIRIGSAGLPMPGVELRVAADGEVELRSPTLMRGYRNAPQKTADALTPDGWLRTGDVGRIDDDGYLWITDRKKDLIISAGGKNMSPSMIEATIKSGAPEIGQVVVIGDGQPYNVALVVPDPDVAGDPSTWDDALDARIAASIERGNAKLSRVEQVKRHTVIREVWLPGGVELTPTLKLRRAAILEAYAPQITALYAARASD